MLKRNLKSQKNISSHFCKYYIIKISFLSLNLARICLEKLYFHILYKVIVSHPFYLFSVRFLFLTCQHCMSVLACLFTFSPVQLKKGTSGANTWFVLWCSPLYLRDLTAMQQVTYPCSKHLSECWINQGVLIDHKVHYFKQIKKILVSSTQCRIFFLTFHTETWRIPKAFWRIS